MVIFGRPTSASGAARILGGRSKRVASTLHQGEHIRRFQSDGELREMRFQCEVPSGYSSGGTAEGMTRVMRAEIWKENQWDQLDPGDGSWTVTLQASMMICRHNVVKMNSCWTSTGSVAWHDILGRLLDKITKKEENLKKNNWTRKWNVCTDKPLNATSLRFREFCTGNMHDLDIDIWNDTQNEIVMFVQCVTVCEIFDVEMCI